MCSPSEIQTSVRPLLPAQRPRFPCSAPRRRMSMASNRATQSLPVQLLAVSCWHLMLPLQQATEPACANPSGIRMLPFGYFVLKNSFIPCQKDVHSTVNRSVRDRCLSRNHDLGRVTQRRPFSSTVTVLSTSGVLRQYVRVWGLCADHRLLGENLNSPRQESCLTGRT